MGRRKPENSTPQKNNSIKDLVGNENKYPVHDPNIMINMTNEVNDFHKKSLKNEIMNELIEILM
jgi:hypothetical protein